MKQRARLNASKKKGCQEGNLARCVRKLIVVILVIVMIVIVMFVSSMYSIVVIVRRLEWKCR